MAAGVENESTHSDFSAVRFQQWRGIILNNRLLMTSNARPYNAITWNQSSCLMLTQLSSPLVRRAAGWVTAQTARQKSLKMRWVCEHVRLTVSRFRFTVIDIAWYCWILYYQPGLFACLTLSHIEVTMETTIIISVKIIKIIIIIIIIVIHSMYKGLLNDPKSGVFVFLNCCFILILVSFDWFYSHVSKKVMMPCDCFLKNICSF